MGQSKRLCAKTAQKGSIPHHRIRSSIGSVSHVLARNHSRIIMCSQPCNRFQRIKKATRHRL